MVPMSCLEGDRKKLSGDVPAAGGPCPAEEQSGPAPDGAETSPTGTIDVIDEELAAFLIERHREALERLARR